MPKDFNAEQLAEVEFARAENARQIFPSMKAPVDPVLDVLVKAREWLSDPTHWCQGTFCRDADGMPTLTEGNRNPAAATCAWGALYIPRDVRLLSDDLGRDAERALDEAMGCIPWVNDAPTTRHADILAFYDRAITARRGA